MKVDSLEVMCDGIPEHPVIDHQLALQLGHPRIYLCIQENNQVTCPYCGKEFIYEPSSG